MLCVLHSGNRSGTCREECNIWTKRRWTNCLWKCFNGFAHFCHLIFIGFPLKDVVHRTGYVPSIMDVNLLDEVLKVNFPTLPATIGLQLCCLIFQKRVFLPLMWICLCKAGMNDCVALFGIYHLDWGAPTFT